MAWARLLRTLIWKELLAEWRSRDALASMFFFAVLALLIFNFALDLSPVDMEDVVPGILWVTFVFAALLGLNRSFQREREQGSLEGLMMMPAPRGLIYAAKLVGNFLFLTIIELCALPVLIILYNIAIPWLLFPILFLGTLGVSASGTIFAAMASNTRLRDVLLPLLLLPIIVPLLVGAVTATRVVLDPEPILSDAQSAILLMVAFDVIFVTLSYLLFDFVLEQ
jgi:heme exporter protein B